MIFETIISTQDTIGNVHITPFGIREHDGYVIISPFKPSTTLTNILSTQCAVVNMTDDVRVFAGAIVKRQQFEVVPANMIKGHRLTNALSHQELTLFKIEEDDVRPKLWMKVVHSGLHAAFKGFNRAQAAVVELAVLVSRLHLLPKEKIEQERAYLQIAMDKTAGEHEWEAWTWLIEKIENFYAEQSNQNQA